MTARYAARKLPFRSRWRGCIPLVHGSDPACRQRFSICPSNGPLTDTAASRPHNADFRQVGPAAFFALGTVRIRCKRGCLEGTHLLQLAAELLYGTAAKRHVEPPVDDNGEPVRLIR
jgi:hypothetical protein